MPSLHRQASRRLGRVIIGFVAALVAASAFTACSHGSAISTTLRMSRKLQLKTPLIPPVPVELIASYPMPEIGGGGLVGIAMGSDGNIWASDDGGNAVGLRMEAAIALDKLFVATDQGHVYALWP